MENSRFAMWSLAAAIITFALFGGLNGRAYAQQNAPNFDLGGPGPLAKFLDKPDGMINRYLGTPAQHAEGIFNDVTCVYYPSVTIKFTSTGEGMDALSVTPRREITVPPCGKQDDPGEKLIKLGEGPLAFEGAKGSFLFLVSTEGYLFEIYNAVSRQRVYEDEEVGDDGIKAVSLDGNTLTIRYLRRVETPCLFLPSNTSCWARTIQTAHLPSAVASQSAPTTICQAAYRAAANTSNYAPKPTDAGYIGYEATVEITPSGKSTVVNRGPVSECGVAN